MLKNYIEKLIEKENLSTQECSDIIELMSSGEVFDSQIAAFLVSLKIKGETPEEISGFAFRMRQKALKINTSRFKSIADSCGTGGDRANTFNISTVSAIIASACGVTIAKHSNYGFSSKCGSSNVLRELGLKLSQNPAEAEEGLQKNNIAFIHAPFFHKSTQYVNNVRKELGIRTVFNFLGPLTNPAFPTGQIVGVSDPNLCPKIASSLKNLGCRRALVVSGLDPVMDEISTCSKTFVSRLNNGIIESFEIVPEDFGIKKAKLEEIQGDTPQVNAKIIENILCCKETGPKKDIVILNTAALLWVGEAIDSIEEGIEMSESAISSLKALKKFESLKLS